MEKTKYVFVILVYRNTDDLTECLESIERQVKSFRVIVVNAFYDDKTATIVEEICNLHKCVFINIENKGYSYGNNRGIELANKLFEYEYVIVSNPDIIIEQFKDDLLRTEFEYNIIAPRITAASGRKQNPMAIRDCRFAQYLQYLGFKKGINLLVYVGIFISKSLNALNLLVRNKTKPYRIYEAHGSFVIISKKAVETLYPLYDENMFLFAEEGVLASRAKHAGLLTCYYDDIHIKHKEDGSMKLGDFTINTELCKANIYCYEHYK